MNATIDEMIKTTTSLMIKYKLKDLSDVPFSRLIEKSSIWGELCVSFFRLFKYSDCLRLKQWWTRDTHRFKTLVCQRLNATNEQEMDELMSVETDQEVDLLLFSSINNFDLLVSNCLILRKLFLQRQSLNIFHTMFQSSAQAQPTQLRSLLT